MRVSDEERQRAVDELRRHCAAGRIDVDEYAERFEKAITASTLEDLDQVMGDLPIMRIADPEDAGRGPSRALGAGKVWSPEDRAIARRLGASLTVIVTVLIVVGAVLLLVLGSWAWAAVLIVGWLIGLAQGRLSGRSR